MGENQPPPAGIVESLRKLGRTGIALIQNRLELFAVELEEQKARLVRALMLAGIAIFLGNTALLAASATIVVLAGEKARIPILVGLTAVYILGTVWAIVALRKELRATPPPFKDSIAELKKDSNWLNRP
jgi:uncharacterized membrane protein YqjE